MTVQPMLMFVGDSIIHLDKVLHHIHHRVFAVHVANDMHGTIIQIPSKPRADISL